MFTSQKPAPPPDVNGTLHDSAGADNKGINLDETSRPKRQIAAAITAANRDTRGRKLENELGPAIRRYWKNPFEWMLIVEAQQRISSWSPTAIVKQLQRTLPSIFEKLSPQVLGRFIDKTGPRKKWKQSVIEEVKLGLGPVGTVTRYPFLKDFPDILASITLLLSNMQQAGHPLTTVTIRGLIVAHIQHRKPELFARKVKKDGTVFRASEAWVKKFVKNELRWVMRRATKCARKVPADANKQIYTSFLRIALTFRDARITHPSLMINFDQTQVVYHLGGGLTYETRGSKQVPVNNLEEKRAFTLTVGVSLGGDLLPFHATFKGKSKASLPKAAAKSYGEAMDLGFIFDFSNTDNYWCTLPILKNYISKIIVPYWTRKKSELKLPPDQECLLQLDVWSVHRSADFRNWIHSTYPWIVLEYIPGACTGIWQACDLRIQRVLKLSVKKSQHQDIVDELLEQFEDGTDPSNTALDTTLGTLRDRCVNWLVTAYKYINNPNIVTKVSVINQAFDCLLIS